jgi:hypothetical protein
MAYPHIIIQNKAGMGGDCYAVAIFCYIYEWHIALESHDSSPVGRMEVSMLEK